MFFLLVCALVGALAAAPAQGGGAPSTAQKSAIARKVATLLEEAGFKYRKVEDGLWVVSFKGQHSDSIEVVVQARNDMVLVLSTVQKKTAPSPALLRRFLEANYNANYSKLGIDEDSDLLSLTELPPDVTLEPFRKSVDEVASLADTAVGLLASDGAAGAPPSERIESVPPATGAKLSLLRGAFEVSYDPTKWKPQATTEPTTTQLNHSSGELWLKVIAERIEVKPEGLRDLAINNAKAAAPEITVDAETWRTVNGLKVLVLRYGGTTSGVKVTFYNQMYSDADGIVQLAGWTTSNLFDEHRHDLLELFAGFRKTR